MEYYIRNADESVRRFSRRILNCQDAWNFLKSEIETLNGVRGSIPARKNSIRIPTAVDFFRAVFPRYKIIEGADEPIYIRLRIGVLSRFSFNEELESIIWDINETSTADSLSEDAFVLIRGALHFLRIYTAFSREDPQVRDALIIFQREYMRTSEEFQTGNLDFATLLFMHSALEQNWHRTPFFTSLPPQHRSFSSDTLPRHMFFRNVSPRYVLNDPVALRASRLHQNVIDEARPSGPCFMRALQSAAEEFLNKNLDLNQIQAAVGALVGPTRSYAITLTVHEEAAEDDGNEEINEGGREEEPVYRYFVNRSADVVNDALQRLGYGNIRVEQDRWGTVPLHSGALTDIENIDLTIRHVILTNGNPHFQLGDQHGNLLWEPFRNHAQINVRTLSNYRIIRFTVPN